MRTRNGEAVLLEALRPLIAAAAEGVVRDVVFLDMGSTDGTARIADAAGAHFLSSQGDQSLLLAVALNEAKRGNWVLLLDQATVLSPGWLNETISFIERQDRVRTRSRMLSAVFRPEDEPELGSADLRRRMVCLIANRLASVAKLSQGILIRRSDLEGSACPSINWKTADPSIKLTNLLRLRSRSHVALPISDVLDQSELAAGAGSASESTLRRATL
ncbi:MAG: glycosyltransferase [Pseudomonadota bacterium]